VSARGTTALLWFNSSDGVSEIRSRPAPARLQSRFHGSGRTKNAPAHFRRNRTNNVPQVSSPALGDTWRQLLRTRLQFRSKSCVLWMSRDRFPRSTRPHFGPPFN